MAYEYSLPFFISKGVTPHPALMLPGKHYRFNPYIIVCLPLSQERFCLRILLRFRRHAIPVQKPQHQQMAILSLKPGCLSYCNFHVDQSVLSNHIMMYMKSAQVS